jgi:hypothetical protein
MESKYENLFLVFTMIAAALIVMFWIFAFNGMILLTEISFCTSGLFAFMALGAKLLGFLRTRHYR